MTEPIPSAETRPLHEAAAVLAVWVDADAAGEADFNDWYNREHLPERADVAGFIDGRRYLAVGSRTRPRYLALYDTAGAAVLDGPEYRRRLDEPTPWTRRTMPAFRNLTRAVLRIEARLGRGHGGTVATVRPRRSAPLDARTREWLVGKALPRIVAAPGIIAADLLVAAPDARPPESEEARLRAAPDKLAPWAVVAEGADPGSVRAAVAAHLHADAFAANGAGAVLCAVYRLAGSIVHRTR